MIKYFSKIGAIFALTTTLLQNVKKTRIYKQHNGSHKDISGKYCIDYPSIYFSEDSIYIVNHDLHANDKEFYFGISYISLFIYDRLNNKWNYSKGFIPELEFRNESSMQKMLKQCFLKAIDTIKKTFNRK